MKDDAESRAGAYSLQTDNEYILGISVSGDTAHIYDQLGEPVGEYELAEDGDDVLEKAREESAGQQEWMPSWLQGPSPTVRSLLNRALAGSSTDVFVETGLPRETEISRVEPYAIKRKDASTQHA